MCISWKKHIAALLLLCLPLVLAACGGGGGGSAGTPVVISGVATKGPIAGGTVSVYRLLASGLRGQLVGSGITASDGSYAVTVSPSEAGRPLVVVVTGGPAATYTSESTGLPVPFSATESFSAAVDSFTPGVNVAVTPLTEVAFQKLPLILAEKPGDATTDKLQSSIVAANTQVGTLFNVSNILTPPAGDPTYLAALLVVDQMIEDSKATGTISDTSAVMTVLNQAIVDVTPTAPAYQTFVEVFTSAATTVTADNPGAVAAIVSTITTQVTAPPAEPDFSDVTAPAVVAGLAATTSANSLTQSSVRLTWTASTDNVGVAGYDVFRDGNKVGTTVTTAFTDPAVTSAVTYAYTVVAFDAAGNRAPASAALSVTPNQPSLNVTVSGGLSSDILNLPQNDVFAPTSPTNLRATTAALTASTSSVTLSWNAATDATGVTGYEVFRNGVKIATATALTYTDPSVASATTFSYTVKAFDAAGNRSVASAALAVTPNQASLGVTVSGQVNTGALPALDVTAPTVPTNLQAFTSAVTGTSSSVTLSWNASADAVGVSGYEVFRNGIPITTSAVTNYIDPSVTSGVTYTYAVKGRDAAGNVSGASGTVTITPNQTNLNITISGQVNPN